MRRNKKVNDLLEYFQKDIIKDMNEDFEGTIIKRKEMCVFNFKTKNENTAEEICRIYAILNAGLIDRLIELGINEYKDIVKIMNNITSLAIYLHKDNIKNIFKEK